MQIRKTEGVNNNVIISANSDAKFTALKTLANQDNSNNYLLIILDYNPNKTLHTSLLSFIHNKNNSQLWLITKEKDKNLNKVNNLMYFHSPEDIKDLSQSHPLDHCSIIIIGDDINQNTSLSNLLSKRNNGTRLEINLSTIKSNLNYHKSLLNPNTKIIAVVKAFAYGTGDVELARYLEYQGVDYLAVASISEGIALRDAHIECPILVLNPSIYDMHLMPRYKLEPEIYSLNILNKFVSLASHLPIHIKIDSGMHRLGFQEQDFDLLVTTIKLHDLKVKSIFSHLMESESKERKSTTLNQIEFFDKVSQALMLRIQQSPLRHILNSGGIRNYNSAQMDMVRIGLGMYGISKYDHNLTVSHSLISSIIQIKKVKKGEYIGYGANNKTQNKMQIAIVNIGYADGILKSIEHKGYKVTIKGKYYPIIEALSMDTLFVDITNSRAIQVGDTVEIFGHNSSITTFAQKANTIPYEILSRISHRVPRVYLYDSLK